MRACKSCGEDAANRLAYCQPCHDRREAFGHKLRPDAAFDGSDIRSAVAT